MFSFTQFLTEATKLTGGIQHLEHPADRTFDSPEAAQHAISTLRGVVSGSTPITRKIDDKMSFQAIRTKEGKVGVKYKGSGSTYNFSRSDVEKQHGHKPYLAGPLNTLLQHVGKVLPAKHGEYQGGFMSTPETRREEGGHISHTPNTVEYHTPVNSAEGQKLKKSKVSLAIHTKLEGPERTAHPITSMAGFSSHPDVHQVQHVVSGKEREIHPDDKKEINKHISAATSLMRDHTHEHLSGHEQHLRTYINSTVRSGETPSTAGYRAHLEAAHNKKIEAVKMDATKAAKTAEKNAMLAHVDKNKKAFDRTFQIHHHVQQATNRLADALDRSSASGGGFQTRIGGQASGGEGYVGGGLKIVNRQEFSKANLAKNVGMRAKNE
jgi:hypothetical protein